MPKRKRLNPSSIDDTLVIYLYKKVLIPWELNFVVQKFNMPSKRDEGFNKFCLDNDILIESPDSSLNIERKIDSFINESRKVNGLFRMASASRQILGKKESYTIPKCLLYHLRNSVAHASFVKKKYKGVNYIYFEGWYREKLKIQAQIKEELLTEFVQSLISTKV